DFYLQDITTKNKERTNAMGSKDREFGEGAGTSGEGKRKFLEETRNSCSRRKQNVGKGVAEMGSSVSSPPFFLIQLEHDTCDFNE
ncbi:hypothetical protein PJP10_32365, partial [Mycobacterium kansasii]